MEDKGIQQSSLSLLAETVDKLQRDMQAIKKAQEDDARSSREMLSSVLDEVRRLQTRAPPPSGYESTRAIQT